MSSILIVGAFPPPIGGNSVHIERLYTMLKQNLYSCTVIDLYGNNCSSDLNNDIKRVGNSKILGFLKTIFFLYSLKYDVVHFHVSSMGRFLYVGFLYFLFVDSKSVRVITIHSGSFPKFVSSLNNFKKRLFKKIISMFESIIAVSEEIRESLFSIGVEERVIHVIPAFLPSFPFADPAIDNIIATARNKNQTIVVTSGYATNIYQYETIIDAISSSSLNDDVFFIICVYNEFNEAYFSFIINKLSAIKSYTICKNLSANIFASILMKSDIYVRATVHDGDCVAIREANYFGKHVVASDCVVRPDFCVLFETSNSDSLASALNKVINGELCELSDMKSGKNYYEQILSIYGI